MKRIQQLGAHNYTIPKNRNTSTVNRAQIAGKDVKVIIKKKRL